LKIKNLEYSRRFRAEVGNGIGAYIDCIDILVKTSIWTNLGCVYFTSKIYRKLFVKPVFTEGIFSVEPEVSEYTHLDLIEFLIVIIVIEHVMMIF